MTRLADARAAILDALADGGIRAGTSGRFSAPVVILEPAEPWAEPARLHRAGRDSHWQLIAIAGSGDADAAFAELAQLVDDVDTALYALDGCGLPTWGKPADRLVGDVTLPSAVGSFTYALR